MDELQIQEQVIVPSEYVDVGANEAVGASFESFFFNGENTDFMVYLESNGDEPECIQTEDNNENLIPEDKPQEKEKNVNGRKKRKRNRHSKDVDELLFYKCSLCTFETVEEETLKDHMLSDHIKGPDAETFIENSLEGDTYSCLFCYYKTLDIETFKEHIREEHRTPPISPSKIGILRPDIKFKIYSCPECAFTTNKKQERKLHIQSAHSYLSSESSEDFLKGSSSSSDANEEKHKNDLPGMKKKRSFRCPKCPFITQGRSLRDYHVSTVHKLDENGSQQTLAGTLSLGQAKPEESEVPAHEYRGRRYKMYKDKARPFPCNKCEFRGKDKVSLAQHARNHGDLQYSCRFCNYRSFKMYRISRHELTHTGERPFECETCGTCFTQNTSLLSHMRNIHHTTVNGKAKNRKRCRSVACKDCRKVFPSQGLLNEHECRDDDGELPDYVPKKKNKSAKTAKKPKSKDVVIKIGDYVLNLGQ